VEETILRVIIGGTVVSTFALLGDVLKPRSFAGLFGAAPGRLCDPGRRAPLGGERSFYAENHGGIYFVSSKRETFTGGVASHHTCCSPRPSASISKEQANDFRCARHCLQ
jgi:hypothetical protein